MPHPYRIGARESVGYYATWKIGPTLAGVIDLTGWTFIATFERYAADPAAFTLAMAATEAAQGFRVWDGPARQFTVRILPATLQGIPDTTGNFTMSAELLATAPGGSPFFIRDIILTIQKGPTA